MHFFNLFRMRFIFFAVVFNAFAFNDFIVFHFFVALTSRLSGWGTEDPNGTNCLHVLKTEAPTSPIEPRVSSYCLLNYEWF